MKANELSAKDLTVGDWVCLPSLMSDDKYPVQVLEIQDDCIKYYVGGKKMMVRFKYVEPIPITPEILEKNGLEVKVGLGGKYQLTIEGVSCRVDFNIIQYVHELQHALRLCRIEKTIEL